MQRSSPCAQTGTAGAEETIRNRKSRLTELPWPVSPLSGNQLGRYSIYMNETTQMIDAQRDAYYYRRAVCMMKSIMEHRDQVRAWKDWQSRHSSDSSGDALFDELFGG